MEELERPCCIRGHQVYQEVLIWTAVLSSLFVWALFLALVCSSLRNWLEKLLAKESTVTKGRAKFTKAKVLGLIIFL